MVFPESGQAVNVSGIDSEQSTSPWERGEFARSSSDEADQRNEEDPVNVVSGIRSDTRAERLGVTAGRAYEAPQDSGALVGESSEEIRAALKLSRARRVGRAIGVNPELALTLLSFLNEHQPVGIAELLEMSDHESYFRVLWDLYDAEVIQRDEKGTQLVLSDAGHRIVKKAGLVQ